MKSRVYELTATHPDGSESVAIRRYSLSCSAALAIFRRQHPDAIEHECIAVAEFESERDAIEAADRLHGFPAARAEYVESADTWLVSLTPAAAALRLAGLRFTYSATGPRSVRMDRARQTIRYFLPLTWTRS